MNKKQILSLAILLLSSAMIFGQVTNYKIGKYNATIDFNKMRMKWDKGDTYSQILEVETSERYVRKFQEIEFGKVTGTFETYYYSDGQTNGTYIRADGKEFKMIVIGINNNSSINASDGSQIEHGNFNCSPKIYNAKVLSKPDLNITHPDFIDSELGTSWTIIATKKLTNKKGTFLVGDLYSPRGGKMQNGPFYIVFSEWSCSN